MKHLYFLNVCNIINLSHLGLSASYKKCVSVFFARVWISHVSVYVCPVSDAVAITESHQCLNASQYSIHILHSNNIQNMHYSIYLLSPRIISLSCQHKHTHTYPSSTHTPYSLLNPPHSSKQDGTVALVRVMGGTWPLQHHMKCYRTYRLIIPLSLYL